MPVIANDAHIVQHFPPRSRRSEGKFSLNNGPHQAPLIFFFSLRENKMCKEMYGGEGGGDDIEVSGWVAAESASAPAAPPHIAPLSPRLEAACTISI